MIASDSTGYPTLAVIQGFDLSSEQATAAYNLGHQLHQDCRRGDINQMSRHMWDSSLPWAVSGALVQNHRRAAVAYGYWDIDL